MRNYIETVMHRYASEVGIWDVVNEAFAADGSYEHNTFYNVIGPAYVEDAFRFAHAADPSGKLFYNDLGAEIDAPKARAILEMVSDFKHRGVPIDGVGLQDHTDVPGYPAQDGLEAMIHRFAALGVRIEITEMDVGILNAPGTLEERYREQANAYRADATACWDIAACDRLTTWGVYDGLTWIGSDQEPLLFDTNYQPKPAYFAVERALHWAPPTRGSRRLAARLTCAA
jgi:endo-1,4-beta-xylanase